MKKLFGIFSLSILLFSTFAPSFTYANEVEDLAKEILTEELENTGNELDNENNGDTTESNAPELNTLNSITTLQTNEAPKTFEECAELVNDNTYLLKYNCDGEINIPSYITMIVGNNTFGGLTISGFNVEGNINVSDWNMFSGTTIIGEITINIDENHNYNGGSFSRMTIGEHGKLTVNISRNYSNAFNWITIREGGELNIESTSNYYDYFNNSEIYGKLSINGTSITNSIEHTYLGKNGQIILGNNIKSLGSDTFFESEILGNLIFSEGIESINSAFNGIMKGVVIKKGLNLPKSLKEIKGSFGHSSISGDITYSGEELTIETSFNSQSIITGNINITGANLSLQSNSFGGRTKITGNFKCSDCGIENYNNSFDQSEIGGDFIFENNNKNIYFSNGSLGLKSIGGDLILSGMTFRCENILGGVQVSGETKIIGKEKLKMESGGFGGYGENYTKLGKSLYLSGKQIEITNSALSNVIINSGFIIDSETFSGTNGSLYNIRIGNDLNIKGQNVYINNSTFGHSIIGGGLEINAEKIGIEYGSFSSSSEIGDNVKINGNNIKLYTSVFEGGKIGKDFLINTNQINVEASSLNNLITSGNIEINANRFEGLNSLSGISLNGDLKIIGSYLSGENIFKGTNVSGSTTIKYDDINLDEDSFYSSIFDNNVDIKGNITTKEKHPSSEIKGVFGYTKIRGDLNISGNNISFNDPTFFSIKSSGDINIKGNNIFLTNASFEDIEIDGNLIISGNNYTGTNGSFGIWYKNPYIGGNVSINGKNLYMNNNNFYKTQIAGNLTISGDNISTEQGALGNINVLKNIIIKGESIRTKHTFLSQSNILGDVKIFGGIFTGESGIINTKTKIGGNLIINNNKTYLVYGAIDNSSISGDIIIESTSLNVYGGSMRNLTTEGDIIIKSNEINTKQEFLKDSKISGNVEIYSDQAEFGLYDFNNSKIDGNLKLPKNIAITDDNFNGLTIGKNILLGGTKTNKPAKSTINGGIIIEDGDNALEEVFKGITVGNNQVTINGTLSNIGAHAYSFKEGTRIINTITLANDFENSDIGDGAFCIQNEPEIKVNAVTTKRFTQEEKQDLYDRACINLTYSGEYNLLLKINGKEEIVVYDGNNIKIPSSLQKDGYTLEWYLDENLTNKADITKLIFEEFEYTKPIYGKYVEIHITPSAGGGSTINPSKQENKTTEKSVEQEHNSAETEKPENTTTDNVKSSNSTASENIKEQVVRVQQRSLTRGEIAVMTNILLDVYPQLTENRELNEVSEACENYADEQNFTKDEKKAITRLCKLSIMGIHADSNKPLDEFMVNEITKNDEFSKVINRSLSTYTEKDFSVVKDALKKLEGDEENVVFGTVYDVFMGIKNIFN